MSLLADKATSNLSGQVEALSKAQREHAAATAGVQASLAELEVRPHAVWKSHSVVCLRYLFKISDAGFNPDPIILL